MQRYKQVIVPGAVGGSTAVSYRKVIQRGFSYVTLPSGGGIGTTNVTISGVSSLSSAVERVTGVYGTASGNYSFSAAIALTSTTNLAMYAASNQTMMTICVAWEIVSSLGTVTRGSRNITTANGAIFSQVTIPAVVLAGTSLYCNGAVDTTAPYETCTGTAQLTSTTNIQLGAYDNAGDAHTVTVYYVYDTPT